MRLSPSPAIRKERSTLRAPIRKMSSSRCFTRRCRCRRLAAALLGDAGYAQLQKQLKPNQQAILVAGKGLYSFKGSGYVRGGIFDRLKLKQDGGGFHFRDRNHRRLGDILAKGAPRFPEIALFVVPEEQTLDVTRPWQLELLVQRATAAREKGVHYV